VLERRRRDDNGRRRPRPDVVERSRGPHGQFGRKAARSLRIDVMQAEVSMAERHEIRGVAAPDRPAANHRDP
jgi:hypothetical protein